MTMPVGAPGWACDCMKSSFLAEMHFLGEVAIGTPQAVEGRRAETLMCSGRTSGPGKALGEHSCHLSCPTPSSQHGADK